MTYRGHVKQGVIILDPPAQLPEGAEVEVRASDKTSPNEAWAAADPLDDGALVSGSVAAALAALPAEDFSDWKK
jgi:hypothetical protein